METAKRIDRKEISKPKKILMLVWLELWQVVSLGIVITVAVLLYKAFRGCLPGYIIALIPLIWFAGNTQMIFYKARKAIQS